MAHFSVDPRARPIYRSGDRGGVLMLHGLTGSPYTFGPMADALSELGYEVAVPLLPGHGTNPQQLRHTRWSDWLVAARRAFDELAQRHDSVFIFGFSMGSLLATVVAQERGQRVAGLIVAAVPIQLGFKSQSVLRLARKLPVATFMPFA
jgi:carboxylesterase